MQNQDMNGNTGAAVVPQNQVAGSAGAQVQDEGGGPAAQSVEQQAAAMEQTVAAEAAKADAAANQVSAPSFVNGASSGKDLKLHPGEDQTQRHHHLTDVEHMQISPTTLLQDCASVSQALFGNFIGRTPETNRSEGQPSFQSKQLVPPGPENAAGSKDTLLRDDMAQKLQFVAKYETHGSCKISKIIAVRKPVRFQQGPHEHKDMLVVHLPKLKFVTIELDENLLEFKIVCLHNFEDEPRLRETGKVNPRQGFLQPFFVNTPPVSAEDSSLKAGHEGGGRGRGRKASDHLKEERQALESGTLTDQLSGFVFLADDTKLLFVQFKPSIKPGSGHTSKHAEEKLNGKNQGLQSQPLEISALKPKLSAEYQDVLVPPHSYHESSDPQTSVAEGLLFPAQIIDLEKVDASQAQTDEVHKLFAIRDIKVVHPQSSNDESPNDCVNLLILHNTHLDKCTGTESKVPSFAVNIYRLQPFRAYRGHAPSISVQDGAAAKSKVVKPFALKLVQRLERLNHYAKMIIVGKPSYQWATEGGGGEWDNLKNDLIYIVTNVSIYAYRQERNTLAEVQTSSIAKIVDDKNEKSNVKMLPPLEEEDNQHDAAVTRLTVQNVIDRKSLELRFDGCTRFQALPNNRLLVIMENQSKYIVHFRFDQADLDVAAVDFIKVNVVSPQISNSSQPIQPHIVPSSIAITALEKPKTSQFQVRDAGCNNQEFFVFISSYFNDQYFLKLSPVFDSVYHEEIIEKRQRLMSSDSQQSVIKELKKKQQKSQIPEGYDMNVLDWLPTLSPITGIMSLPNQPEGDNELASSGVDDLIISSGHSQSAQLTLVRSKTRSYLAIDQQSLLKINGIKDVFSLRFEKSSHRPDEGANQKPLASSLIDSTENKDNEKQQVQVSTKQFIVLSIENQTRILEHSGRLTEIEYGNSQDSEASFNVKESTISCQKISDDEVLQATESELILLKFDFESKTFARTKSLKLESGQSFSQVLDHSEEQDCIFAVIQKCDPALGDKKYIRSFSLKNLAIHEQPVKFDRLSHRQSDEDLDIQAASEFKIQMANMTIENYIAVITNNKQQMNKNVKNELKQVKSQNLHIFHQAGDKYRLIFTNSDGQINMQSAVLFNEKGNHQNPNSCQGLSKSATDISIDLDFRQNSASARRLDETYHCLHLGDRVSCMPTVIDFHITSFKCGSNGVNTPGKVFMSLVYGNARTAVYELALSCLSQCHDGSLFASRERHCFKLVKSQTLNKLQNLLTASDPQITDQNYKRCIFHENNQVLIFYNNLKLHQKLQNQTLVITERKGRFLFNQLPQPEFDGIKSHASFKAPQKQSGGRAGGPGNTSQQSSSPPMSQLFLCILESMADENRNTKEMAMTSLCMGIFAPNLHFDVRQSNLVSEGVALKRFALPPLDTSLDQHHRGIKSICIHKGRYLVLATFEKVQTRNAPVAAVIDQGFNPNLRNMADDFRYAIEVYQLPQIYRSDKNSAEKSKQQWKELQNLQRMACSLKNKFQDDEVISSMQSLKLDIQHDKKTHDVHSTPQGQTIPDQEEFLIVSTIKLKHQCDKAQYPSCMYIFQIIEQSGVISIEQLGQYPQKRLISCIKAYRGKLLSVQHKDDFQIVTQQMKYNTNEGDIQEQQLKAGINARYVIDQQSAQWNPQSIQNMARFISIEKDYIFIGDIYKNFQVFKPKDADELRRDNIEDFNFISLKKRFQSKADAHCIGVYSVTKLQTAKDQSMDATGGVDPLSLNQPTELNQTMVFSASQEGTLRTYSLRGQKHLECTSQFNIKDAILRVLPQPYQSMIDCSIRGNKLHNDRSVLRSFLVVPRHGSLLHVSPCTPLLHHALLSLAVQMSLILPFTFGITPALALGIDTSTSASISGTAAVSCMQTEKTLGITPCFLSGCSKNLGSHLIIQALVNNTSRNLVDARSITNQFLSLNFPLQAEIARRIGFEHLHELLELLAF